VIYLASAVKQSEKVDRDDITAWLTPKARRGLERLQERKSS